MGLLAVGVLAGGCSNSGSYRVDWQFAPSTAQLTTSNFRSGDCGRVGVGGIRITATRSDGSVGDARAVPCGPGFFEGSLEQGTWSSLTLVALDGTGQVKERETDTPPRLTGQTGSVEIHTGELAAPIAPIFLIPLPQCRDGVDNDLDGRVDLDDADCSNRELDSECGATDGASCNDNRPGA